MHDWKCKTLGMNIKDRIRKVLRLYGDYEGQLKLLLKPGDVRFNSRQRNPRYILISIVQQFIEMVTLRGRQQ